MYANFVQQLCVSPLSTKCLLLISPPCLGPCCSSGAALAAPANHRPASSSRNNIKYKQNNRVGDFYSGPHTHGATTTTTNISIFSSNTFLCLHLNRWKFKCNFAMPLLAELGAVSQLYLAPANRQLHAWWHGGLQCCRAAVLQCWPVCCCVAPPAANLELGWLQWRVVDTGPGSRLQTEEGRGGSN